MTNQQAAALRDRINMLAEDLRKETGKAEIRNLKLQIRAAEIELTEGK